MKRPRGWAAKGGILLVMAIAAVLADAIVRMAAAGPHLTRFVLGILLGFWLGGIWASTWETDE